MDKNKLLYLLGTIVIVIGILTWPSSKKINDMQAKLDSTNVAIKNYHRQITQLTEFDKNFDLPKAEQVAQQQVSEGVGLALGGIHSKKDWQTNQDKLNNDLGKKLSKELIQYSQDRNTGDYITAKNDFVTVSFKQVNTPEDATINVASQFERQDGTKKYVLITGKYNLKTHQFISSKVSPLAKQAATQIGGEN